jgi:hypothetical protein
MAFSTFAKNSINRFLSVANLQLSTLTDRKAEERRLNNLVTIGHFGGQPFPIPDGFQKAKSEIVLDELRSYQNRFEMFRDPSKNDVGYCFDNQYFRSPDAEVLYTIIRKFQPRQIIEVGSGNSTKIARQAIADGKLSTILVSIDPLPRAEIDSLADEIIRRPAEHISADRFTQLGTGDILFIDSSHEARIGTDVTYLFSMILPRLKRGVLIHVHDIFLPYDYPIDLIREGNSGWNEQYLLQSMLYFGNAFEVIWPGYFLQMTREDFREHFPHLGDIRAQSFWMRKI